MLLHKYLFLGNMGRIRKKLSGRPYKNYPEERLVAALNAIATGMSSRRAEEIYKIPRRTLLNKRKHLYSKKVGRPTALSEVEERHLVDVIIACAEYGAPFTQLELRMAVRDYLNKKGVDHPTFKNNLPGKSWTEEFVSRHKHRLTKRQCQNLKRTRAAITEEDMNIYFDNLKKSLEGVDPELILNYDETNLSDNPGTTKCIFSRGTKYPERYMNSTKTAISMMFAATASGETLPLYVVYKSERLYDRWISGGPPGTVYNRSRSGWFDAITFEDWFMKIVIPWSRRSTKPKVLIGDNLSSHLNVDVLRECQRRNIRFVFLPPNTTQLTQPLDVSYFRPLKQAWRSILTKIKLEHPRLNCVEKNIFPQLLTDLIKKMEFNSAKNIRSGFKATGIYPFNPDAVYKKMPNERYKTRVETDIDNAFLTFLKDQRSPINKKAIQRGKKKMLNIKPGCSVSAEDISSSTTPESRTDEPPESSATDEVIVTRSVDDSDKDSSLDETSQYLHDEDENRMEEETESEIFGPARLKQGLYVIVEFATKKTCKHFIGTIIENEDLNENFTVKFLRKKNNGFVFPQIEDISLVNFFDIKEILPTPVIKRRGVFTFSTNISRYNL